ncbi:acyltransferase family protein [Cellulomonas sp. ICMP 17802]|uniref:acyltransferase family protein n=1 Tax=Cellulomonas sp. ICMP 17802 TaxID=3239199 RepID=UPI00351AE2A0
MTSSAPGTARPPTRGYSPALDGLRALAVLAVLAYHSLGELFPGGHVGVDVFFVLSGFLITGILMREVERTGSISFKAFYARRAIRLFPALVLLVAVAAVAFAVIPVGDRADEFRGLVAAVTYTSSPLQAAGVNLSSLGHAWSLSVEEYFYLVWPLLLLAVARWWPHRLLAGTLSITAAAVLYQAAIGTFTSWPVDRVYYAPDTRAAQLLVGCSLAVLVARGRAVARPFMAIVAIALITAFVLVEAMIGPRFYRDGGSTLVALAAAVAISAVVHQPESRVARTLAIGPLVWIGRRSYGIYLWGPVLATIVATVVPHSAPLLPIILVLTFVVPALSFRFVEKPFLELKSRFEPRTNRADERPTPRVQSAQPERQ